MAKAEKMDVFLAPEIAALVKAAVESGEYTSISDVIADALLEWQVNRSGRELDVEELRRLCQEGIDSGPGRYSSIEEIIAEARRRFEATKAGS